MNRQIKIAGQPVGAESPCFFIAEAGVNHNGHLSLAKKMVVAARAAGADAIKFQTFRADSLVTRTAPKADYQKIDSGGTQYEMLKSLELSESDFKSLSDYCKKKKIIFLSTPFDFESSKLLKKLDVPAFKIGSGELTNLPLIYQIAKYKKPIILSTGMSTLQDIEKAVKTIYNAGNKRLIILHCTTNYPTEYKNVNLRALQTIQDKFKVMVGFSDHTKDDLAAIISLGAGAVMIEKHLTLDKNMSGPDHKSSIEPEELKNLIRKVRKAETILGSGIKKPCKSELAVKKIVQKSIFSKKNIKKGQTITAKMLEIKRPVIGELPESLEKIIGKIAKKDILVQEPIYFKDIK